jgi:tryptophanyl-tRNA synthetase
MMTDPARKRKTDTGDPELSPVYHLHKIFSSPEEIEFIIHGCRTAGIGCIECKKVLIKNVFAYLEPTWKRRAELINNPDMLYDIAKRGSEKAAIVAEETMKMVREVMGLG